MLRENRTALWYGWMAAFGILAGACFWFLTGQPAFQPSPVPTPKASGLPAWLPSEISSRFSLALIVSIGWPILLRSTGVFRSQRREPLQSQLTRMAAGHSLAAAVFSAVAFTISAPISNLIPITLAAVLFTTQAILHILVFAALHRIRRKGQNSRNIVILGSGPRALTAEQTISAHPEWGYQVLGFLDDESTGFQPVIRKERIYNFEDFPELVRSEVIDEVLIACPRSMIGELDYVVGVCMTVGIEVTMLTDLFGEQLPPARSGAFGDVNTLCFAPVHHSPTQLAAKRALDLIGGSIGLAIALPVVALAALFIRLSSRGPIFFKQTRSGRNGRAFEMVKLRTMVPDAESLKEGLQGLNELDGPVFKITNDPRITPVGRVLRKFSIDELPQFWNVLRGEMSLVGPRPPTPDEVLQYTGSERRRLSMRPGLTCLWQVSGRNAVGFEDWMKLDLEYIDDWSLLNDAQILARTIPAVFLGRGAA